MALANNLYVLTPFCKNNTIFAVRQIVLEMKHKIKIAACLCIAVLCMAGCKDKKEDKTTYSSYFSGSIYFDLPAFVQQGEEYLLTPSEVSRNSSDESTESYGIFWRVSPTMDKSDTVRFAGADAAEYDGSFRLVIPDTLCTLTVTCCAYASGYYNSSSSATCMIVDPSEEGGSLTGLDYAEPDLKFTDARDGREYRYVTLGSHDWMARNLAWDGAGASYSSSVVMDNLFGRMYTWEEAASSDICPAGWHLPTNAEWLDLSNAISGRADTEPFVSFAGIAGALRPKAYLNDILLWDYQPHFDITNSTFMNMLPVGYAQVTDGNYRFSGLQNYAVYWTGDEYDGEYAYYRFMYTDKADLLVGYGSKTDFAASVRCCR